MGTTMGASASSHARVTRCGETPWASAICWNAWWFSPTAPARVDAAERAPRQEGDAHLGAHLELGVAAHEGGRELVLDAHEPSAEKLVRETDLLRVGVGDSGHLDDALVEQLDHCADRVGVGNLGVGAVELVQADGLDAEALGRLPWRPP